MSNQEIEEIDKNKIYYLYFIENYEKKNKIEIYLKESENSIFRNSLEKVYSEEILSKDKNLFEISVYRFRINYNIIKEEEIKKKSSISVRLKLEDNSKFEAKINIKEIEENKNCFLFNLKFGEKNLLSLSLPQTLILSNSYHFDMYAKTLIKKYNFKSSDKEMRDLVYYATKKLEDDNPDKKKLYYDYLYFFSDILIEYFEEEDIRNNHLLAFEIDKVHEKKCNSNKFKLNEVKNRMNLLLENIKTIFNNFGNNKILKAKFVSILFCFNYYFQKEQIELILGNDLTKQYLVDIIPIYMDRFIDLKLNKEYINILVKRADSYNMIREIFKYNNNFQDLLEVINKNNYFIFQLFHRAKKNLELEKFIIPKKEDNLNEIFNQIKISIENETKISRFYILFNDKIFEHYIEFFNNENLNKLILIYNILKYIKINDKLTRLKSIDKTKKLIKTMGSALIQEENINNFELLNFIENEEFYSYKDLPMIVKKFDINKMNSDFFIKWKECNIRKIFKEEEKFYEEICNFVEHMKDFGILYNLFNIGIEESTYDKKALMYIQKKFRLLLPTFIRDECPNFIENIIDLFYYSDINEVDITSLYEFLKKNYSEEEIGKIFNGLIERKNDYSDDLTFILIKYFTEKIEYSNDSSLSYILIKSNCIENKVNSYLESIILSKEDFFMLEENKNLKIYKKLWDMKVLNTKNLLNSDYLKKCTSVLNDLKKDLKEGNIKYKYINPFYSNEKYDELFNRLLIISDNKKEEAIEYKNKIDECMKNNIKIIDDLNLFLDILNSFYYDSEFETIKKYENLKNNIFTNNINYYISIYKDYTDLINRFENEVKEKKEYKDNKLFIFIYKNLKKIYNYEDNKSFSEAIKFNNIIKIILEENNVRTKKIDMVQLINYLKYLNIEEKELFKYIEYLITNFNIKNEVDIEKITKELRVLSQRDIVIMIVNLYIYIIELINPIKTKFYSILNTIKNNINNSKELCILEFSKSILNKLKIDINENTYKYINILIKLEQNPEIIKFLFNKNIYTEDMPKKLKKINEDNNNAFIGAEKCFLYINNFLSSGGKREWNDKDIILNIHNIISNNKDIVIYFTNYIDNFEIFKSLL